MNPITKLFNRRAGSRVCEDCCNPLTPNQDGPYCRDCEHARFVEAEELWEDR